jgi:hypothetical protein
VRRGPLLLLAALAALVVAAPAKAAVYVGLGDSYSSGTGTASSYGDNCQRTTAAYPVLLVPQLGSGPNLSCSGARTQHITTEAQTPGNTAPQVNLPGLGADTQYVTLQIGGNDAGFVDVLVDCANPISDCNAAIEEARETAQEELPPKLAANYAAVRAKAPNAKIAVVGYPRLFRPNESCNVFYSASEVNSFNAAADELDEMIRTVAHAQGIAFADPRPIFIGHGACDSVEWINGLSPATFSNSYHPKVVGHSSGFHPVTLATIQQIPETTIGTAPSNPSNNASPTFQFTSSVANSTFQCKLDGGAYAACASPRQYTGLSQGSHTLLVRAVHPTNGNADQFPAVHTWTIDTTPPPLTLDPGGPSGTVALDDASFTFSTSDVTAQLACRLDGGAFEPCASPRAYEDLGDGAHEFTVRATDQAGNAATASRAWTVDTTPPTAAINSGPSDPTASSDASFEFSADDPGADFECALDEDPETAVFTPCATPYELTGLGEGEHVLHVRALDALGNVGPVDTFEWTIDTEASTVIITSAPPALTNQSSVDFAFAVDDPSAAVDCSIDGGAFEPCDSADGHAYSGLADGEHVFTVRATDLAGNPPATDSRSFTVDTVAPGAEIGSGPPALTQQTDAEVAFSSADLSAGFECRFDSTEPDDFEPCASPESFTGLPDGPHALDVRAVDPAGNEGTPVTHAWVVDTTAPTASISGAPSALTKQDAASFAFSAGEPGSSFECRLDSTEPTDFGSCDSPRAYEDLADGPHRFEVRATDPAGNQQQAPTVHEWTIDSVAPVVTITGHPDDPSQVGSASFAFESDKAGSSFDCRLTRLEDPGPAPSFSIGCPSPSYPTLADGSYVFEVRATDPLGNVGEPAVFAWSIDRITPTVTIDSGPEGLTPSALAEFEFSANDPEVAFECRIDSEDEQDWELCNSPAAYPQESAALAEGPHTFQVRVSDAAENSSIATREWVVDTVGPSVEITAAPSAASGSANASFSFATAGDVAAVECDLDDGGFGACTSPRAYTGLADGAHVFTVRARDAAGNSASAALTWTVDTVRPETTITGAPPASTTDTAASFTFGSSEAGSGFQCSLDGAVFAACASPLAHSGLAVGEHGFRVRAVDAAGNVDASPAAHAWRITAPPAQTGPQVQGQVGGGKAKPKCKRAKKRSAGKAAKKGCKKPKKKK